MFKRIKCLSLLVMLAVFVLTACGGAEERKAQYFKQGMALFSEGNYVKARLEFKNVLQIDPKHVDALFMLGQAHEKEAEWAKAYGAFNRVVELDPAHIDGLVRKGRILLAANQAEQAMETVVAALKLNPRDAGALTLRGFIHFRQQKLDAAMADAEAVIKAQPGQVEATSLIAMVKAGKGDLDGAVQQVAAALENQPEEDSLRLLLVQLYEKQGNEQGVINTLQELTQRNPEKLAIRARLAEYLRKTGKPEQAEAVIRAAIKQAPEADESKLLLVRYLAKSGKTEMAEQELNQFIAAAPDNYELRFALAELYRAGKQGDKAKGVYRGIIQEDKADAAALKARNFLATMHLEAKDITAAESLLAEVLEKEPREITALLLRARIALSRKSTDQAVGDLRNVLHEDPANVQAVRLLAAAHILKGETELAQEKLEQAVQLDPAHTQSYLQLAELKIRAGDSSGALKILEGLMARSPDNLQAQQALARVQLGKEDWKAVQETASRIKQTRQDHALGDYLMGLAYQGQDKLAQSIGEFEAALAKSPNAAEPMVALARAYLKLQQPQKAAERVQQVIKESPTNAFARNLLGEIYLVQDKSEQAKAQFREVITYRPKSRVGYLSLARALRKEEKAQLALEILEEGRKATEDDPYVLLELAALYEQIGRHEDAIVAYEQLHQRFPEVDVVANNYAMALVRRHSGPEDLTKALAAAKRFEESKVPQFVDTLGWVHIHRGELEQAITLLEKALQKAPDLAEVAYHLGVAYHRKGDKAQARDKLSKALALDKNFPGAEDAKQMLASLSTE